MNKRDIPPDTRPYRPCNGSEGEWFTSKWCENCAKHPRNNDAVSQCGILLRTFEYDVDDKEYPWQWRLYGNGIAVCLAFKDRREEAIKRALARKARPRIRIVERDDKTIDIFNQST